MMRLVKRGLMFGNLVEISSPALVARYNRALKHLISKETELTEFHIDISGYSPEIGQEFEDILYLNPKGCNQMFILLSTDQKTAPLLNSKFSTSRSILHHYIEENEDELFALTAREAVAGELMNSIFEVNSPSDLLNINQIDIDADTIQAHVKEAKVLQDQIDKFMTKDDAWWDDVLIAQMIELAKRTGNIQSNPVKLHSESYTQGNYYTTHFGGIYIFRDVETPTIIARNPIEGLEDLDDYNVLTFEDREAIAEWLRDEELSQLIVQAKDQATSSVIRQKMDFILIAIAANDGHNLDNLTRQNLRQFERAYSGDLPAEFHGLMAVWRWAILDGRVPRLGPQHPAFFYALRSSQHKDRDLVNMLLSDLSPLDFRQMFICHKDAFYDAYRGWSDTKKDYVARFLSEEYAMDKVGAREALFGSEPKMEDRETPKSDPKPRRKKRHISPWGTPVKKAGVSHKKHYDKDEDFREIYKEYRRKNYRKKKRDD